MLRASRIDEDGYLEGAPELVAEITASTVSYDLHDKLHVYRRSGVQEYLVWRTIDGGIDWFTVAAGKAWFVARTAAHGEELWVTDGTTAGTSLVVDLWPGSGSSSPRTLTPFGSAMLFTRASKS